MIKGMQDTSVCMAAISPLGKEMPSTVRVYARFRKGKDKSVEYRQINDRRKYRFQNL
jgi:hypothetical protein